MRSLRLALLLASAAAAEEAGDPVRYVRGSPTIAEALEQVGGLLGAADAQSIVFVFEQFDFGERQRFFDERDYHVQLAEWLEKVATWAATRQERVRVALTGSSKPFAPGGCQALLQEARRAEEVSPARWIARLAHFAKGKSGALVYISGQPREGRIGGGRPEWDPEVVAASFNRAGARLYVVMPEARFTEFLPAQECVDLPKSWWRVPEASPTGQRFYGGWADWGTDCPSAYGFAAYARATAATRGAYVFYPGQAKEWHDPCPFNAGLLTELVPRMPTADEHAAAAAADPVLREIAETSKRCAPLAAFESEFTVPPHEAKKIAHLAGAARANASLCAAEADRLAGVGRAVEAGELKGASRRSLAQLRYSRFVLEACAYHSAAWAEAAEKIEEFVASGKGREEYEKRDLAVGIWAHGNLEMRDFLEAPEGYARSEDLDVRLRFAKRSIEDLPAALRGRAERVLVAGRDVMKHEALTPWGWMTYYSDIVTFEPDWTGSLRGGTKRFKPDSDGKDPTTPPDEPGAPGSGGSGPTTGG